MIRGGRYEQGLQIIFELHFGSIEIAVTVELNVRNLTYGDPGQ